MQIDDNDALLVVDVQNDFCPGGALPVPGGDMVVTAINRLTTRFDRLYFSRDWHPRDHCSFSLTPEFRDMSWPEHCVQQTPGAEFHGSLRVPLDATIIDKGDDPDAESYSAFGNPALEASLRERGIKRVFIAGLATDYCVKATALDALKAGFEAVLVEDGCRGIDDEGVIAAIAVMKAAGVECVQNAGALD